MLCSSSFIPDLGRSLSSYEYSCWLTWLSWRSVELTSIVIGYTIWISIFQLVLGRYCSPAPLIVNSVPLTAVQVNQDPSVTGCLGEGKYNHIAHDLFKSPLQAEMVKEIFFFCLRASTNSFPRLRLALLSSSFTRRVVAVWKPAWKRSPLKDLSASHHISSIFPGSPSVFTFILPLLTAGLF